MYLLDNWWKFVLVALLVAGYSVGSSAFLAEDQMSRTEAAMDQMKDNGAAVQHTQMKEHGLRNNGYVLGWAAVALLGFLVFLGDLKAMLRKLSAAAILLVALANTGCWKPFEPVKLEVIKSNEEAFLIPLDGDAKKQQNSSNEEYLKANLVYTKQVKIPQQWVPKGFETWSYNGVWQDAAILVRVDKSPVTREWTADKNSGTSDRNEAVWVMTSDQVEFSTGWTITARISNREDAIKFLHNYQHGSLAQVMDSEVRSKLQAEFGLEVTDLPMDTLRKQATPHIQKVTKSVSEFFKERGITITNIGITGGFVYKDKSILDTMVRVFNAEQEKSVAIAETNAQRERNQKVILKATGEADAIMKTRKAEADGIKMVADARMYELEKAAQALPAYVQLKQIELQKELLGKWDGAYPRYFMGTGTGSSSPQMLLQLPPIEPAPVPAKKQ